MRTKDVTLSESYIYIYYIIVGLKATFKAKTRDKECSVLDDLNPNSPAIERAQAQMNWS